MTPSFFSFDSSSQRSNSVFNFALGESLIELSGFRPINHIFY